VFFVLANVDFSRVDVWLKVKQSVESLTAKLPWLNTQQKGMIEDLRKMNREALSIKQEEVTDTLKTETTGALQNNIVAKPVAKQLVYHIIAGSFKSKANALECIKKLQHMGYNPVLLNFNDTLFRVSLISNPNRQKAVEDYIQITQQHPDMKIWFYSQYE
jgi:hypothetical protein